MTHQELIKQYAMLFEGRMIDPIIEAGALINRLSTGYGVTISREEAEEIRQEIAKSKEQQRKVMSIFDWRPSEEDEKDES